MSSPRRFRLALVLAFLVSTAAAGASCSCGDEETATTGGAPAATAAGSGGAGGGSAAGTGGELFGDAGPECGADGEPCEGGVCAGGRCCDADLACGSACCVAGSVCSFQECVVPGATCVDATDCPDDHYCEYALGEQPDGGAPDAGCVGGVLPSTGKCLPKPPECAPGREPRPGGPITCLAKCEYKPPVGAFSPVLKYAWGDPAAPNTRDSVMMAPVVIQLDDDTCDGVVDERDIPEIVFLTFASGNYNGDGTLHAVSMIEGTAVHKWEANAGATSPNHPGRSIAAGNIDGQPGNEIVVCTTDKRVRAYDAGGVELWLSEPGAECIMPALADLDQDGDVEVVVESMVLDGVTGAQVVPSFSPPNTANVVVSDVDGDGLLDIVTASAAYRGDGSLIASTGIGGRYPAVGDLDRDGIPEVVVSDYANHELIVWQIDPAQPNGTRIVRQDIDINGALSPTLCAPGSAGSQYGGGPPTVADFDGDGFPDVALAGGVGYAVFDGEKIMDPAVPNPETFLWVKQTQDCSSAATGSAVFDFDGDGKAEVIYADEVQIHVYAGPDGAELFSTCNTNGTLFEYPLVADVDNDGQADIVVVSNSYSGFNCAGVKTAGVRVFGDESGNWVRTRRVWNQHGYHVTNVAEDGTIPTVEETNWLDPDLNNFRQNVQPEGEFSAPDLVVSLAPACPGPTGLVARVTNLGEAAVPPGVVVGFYLGDPAGGGTLLGQELTTKALYPAESEDVLHTLVDPPPSIADGSADLYAVVDDGSPPHTWHECRTDNNTSVVAHGQCGSPR